MLKTLWLNPDFGPDVGSGAWCKRRGSSSFSLNFDWRDYGCFPGRMVVCGVGAFDRL